MRLILAPHHDDALLSMPGLLLAPDACRHFEIVVVFSEECPRLERVCGRLHRALGFTPIALGLPEARLRGLSIREILRARRAPAAGGEIEIDLAARLAALCIERGARAMIAPAMAIHVDHALVAAAATRAAHGVGLGVEHYEDLPYALMAPLRSPPQDLLPRSEAAGSATPTEIARLLAPLRPFLAARDVERIRLHFSLRAETVA